MKTWKTKSDEMVLQLLGGRSNHEIAIVGDAMFGVFRGSVLPPFGDDIGQMIQSWGSLLDTGCSVFLPAHPSKNHVMLRAIIQVIFTSLRMFRCYHLPIKSIGI
jgi:glyoxylase-like metal-dependent hydrolase (beta-lactamase superfamily II)